VDPLFELVGNAGDFAAERVNQRSPLRRHRVAGREGWRGGALRGRRPWSQGHRDGQANRVSASHHGDPSYGHLHWPALDFLLE